MSVNLRWGAAGAALPGLFFVLLDAGMLPSWAAAACACAVLLFAAMEAGVPRLALAAAAAGCAVGTALLLPVLGARPTLLAAALCLVPARPHPEERRADPLHAALAAGGLIGVWRMLSYLLGHSAYAACLLAVFAAAGAAVGRGKKPWLSIFPGAAALLAGLSLLACAELLRLVGLNHLHPEHVHHPLLDPAEVLSYCLHAGAGAFGAAVFLASEDRPVQSLSARLAAAAGPLLAALILPRLGASETAALFGLGLCAAGAARGFAAWRSHAILSRVVPSALLAAAALAWLSRGALPDIAVNRLMAVFPGGEPLLWKESGGQALMVYKFSSGVKVALRDGLLDYGGGDLGRLEAHLPLLARGGERALFVNAMNPEVYRSAAAHGARAELWDRRPWCAAALSALGGPESTPPSAIACGRREPPPGPFDTVVVEIEPPITSPESALAVTAEAARRWRSTLTPGGVLAWRVPAAPGSKASNQAAAALRTAFAGVYQASVGPGTLLLATDSRPKEWKASLEAMDTGLRADAAWIADHLAAEPSPWTVSLSTSAAPTASRPFPALFLGPRRKSS